MSAPGIRDTRALGATSEPEPKRPLLLYANRHRLLSYGPSGWRDRRNGNDRRDSVVSASSALDGKVFLSKGVTQLASGVMVCEASDLKAAALQSGTLLTVLY